MDWNSINMAGSVCEVCQTPVKGRNKLCKKCQDEKDNDVNTTRSGELSLNDILTSINQMEKRLESRIDRIEETISEKIKNIVHQEISSFKDKVETEIQTLKDQVKELQSQSESSSASDEKPLCIVVRNLPVADEEGDEDQGPLMAQVNKLIEDGVQLDDVEVESAERKKSYRDDVPGVVIAQCKSRVDKELIMENKSNLQNSDEYSEVRIFHHKTPAQLQLESSLRTIVSTVGADKLKMKGSRVVRKSGEQGNQGWQTAGRGRNRGRGRGRGQGRGSGGQRGQRGQRGSNRGNMH